MPAWTGQQRRGQGLPEDLCQEDDWQRRYNDLEYDIHVGSRPQRRGTAFAGQRTRRLPQRRPGDFDRTTDMLRDYGSLLRDYEFFGGRTDELSALRAFADDPRGGYLFVTGASGSGKTSLLACYARLNDVACHFINRAYGTADEERCLRNLCQQLAARHPRERLPVPGTMREWREQLRALAVLALGGRPPCRGGA